MIYCVYICVCFISHIAVCDWHWAYVFHNHTTHNGWSQQAKPNLPGCLWSYFTAFSLFTLENKLFNKQIWELILDAISKFVFLIRKIYSRISHHRIAWFFTCFARFSKNSTPRNILAICRFHLIYSNPVVNTCRLQAQIKQWFNVVNNSDQCQITFPHYILLASDLDYNSRSQRD